MMTLTIYGASDDLIEVEGDLAQEFATGGDDEPSLLVFSDGTVLRVHYTEDGVWRITQERKGAAAFTKVDAVGGDDDNYSDRVTLTGDFAWLVYAAADAVVYPKPAKEG